MIHASLPAPIMVGFDGERDLVEDLCGLENILVCLYYVMDFICSDVKTAGVAGVLQMNLVSNLVA